MKIIINNNPAYGDMGPYKAESFEALADEMEPVLKDWANESGSKTVEDMRAEFIRGLTEIVLCLYCDMWIEKEISDEVPATDDDEEWAELAKHHEGDCEWVATRAHRKDV
ncbi:MAG: hypothetical protein DRJ03_11700 [Chloroflexi bacterium]|nr:MAG: hypothetical protein DRJ03_11700 [Chloroflexota bacterium]